MFMMNTDSHLFRNREQLTSDGWLLEGNVFVRGDTRYLPLNEAKLFHQYDHRFATFDDVEDRALRGGNARNVATNEKADPGEVVIPRNLAGNPDSPQAVIFLASITDVIMGF